MTLSVLGFLNLSLVDILDILVVAAAIFVVIRWIRNSSAMNIFIAILLLFIVREIAVALDMKLVSSMMGTVLDVGVIALFIIFQPEIRHFLFRLGSPDTVTGRTWKKFYSMLGIKEKQMGEKAISELVDACREMSDQKIGALIVLPHKNSIQHIVDTGDIIDAHLTKRLVINIFFKNSPLHDGAMIVRDDKIVAARCTLPMTQRADLPAQYGMRHKSAVGMTEESDADVVVVSEETGGISFVRAGVVTKVKNGNELRLLLGAAPLEGEAQGASPQENL